MQFDVRFGPKADIETITTVQGAMRPCAAKSEVTAPIALNSRKRHQGIPKVPATIPFS